MGETLAYWKEWFYRDALRQRDHLRRDLADTRGMLPQGKDHQAALEAELGQLIGRINALNDVLRDEHEEAVPGAEAAREAAARGELPEGLGSGSVAAAREALMARMGKRPASGPV